MGTFTQGVEVTCSEWGEPTHLVWDGREHEVCESPTLWFARRWWWDEELRIPLGLGDGVVDHELWRLQVRPVAADIAEPVTVDVAHYRRGDSWRLIKLHLPERREYAALDPAVVDF